jgi:hypothetical protein
MRRITVTGTAVLFLVLGIIAPTYAHLGQQGLEAKPPTQEQQKPDKQQQDKDKQQQEQKKKKKQQQEQKKQQQQPTTQQKQDQKQQQQQEQKKQQQQPTTQQKQDQKQQQQQEQQKRQQQRTQQQQQEQQKQQQQRTQQQQQQQQGTRPSQQERRVPQGEQAAVWQQHRARSWQTEHRTWQQRGGYNGYRVPADRFSQYYGQNHVFRIYSQPMVIAGGYPRFQYGGYWFNVLDPWPEYWPNNWYQNDDVYIDYSGDGYYLYNRRYPRDRIAISIYLNFVPQGEQRTVWQQYRARSWQNEHRTWYQRGGYNGYRIPGSRFRTYFGRDHRFNIYRLPMVMVGGYPRMEYGGVWFSLVDPWPEYWPNNWYQDDDMYIDYSGDGYYLYNRRYPQDRIAIVFYLNVN